jgi:hypothetical protein
MLKLWEQNENKLWKQSETWEHLAMLEQIVKEKWGVGTTLKTIERRLMQKEKIQNHWYFIMNKKNHELKEFYNEPKKIMNRGKYLANNVKVGSNSAIICIMG